MRILLLALTTAVVGSGCVHARIVDEVAPTLQCPASQIAVHQGQPLPSSFFVTGCGRAAICTLPKVEGAEVTCVGGGPVVAAK
jgi:hypothetical protein